MFAFCWAPACAMLSLTFGFGGASNKIGMLECHVLKKVRCWFLVGLGLVFGRFRVGFGLVQGCFLVGLGAVRSVG